MDSLTPVTGIAILTCPDLPEVKGVHFHYKREQAAFYILNQRIKKALSARIQKGFDIPLTFSRTTWLV